MTQEIGREALRFRYWYDSMGQISQWRNPVRGVYQHYEYDAQNQLIRETHLSGQNINTGNNINGEFIYEYDTFGNIRRRTHRNAANVVVTTAFSYDYDLWPDLLTAVDGNPITYDRSGNPLRWHDGTEFTWTRGRQLIHAQNPEAGLDVSFTYDQNGIRTGKTVERNGVITEHTFYTQNGRLVGEVRRNANGEITDRLEFIYDEAGRPIQMIHNGNPFNYVLNLQGDVLQLRCAWTGENVAAYVYNAWGHLLIAVGRMAEINPLRYRGYVFCSSLGMYYLQSRYYDPWIGRFINADAFVSTGQGFLGFNMFAYCLNNPVNLHDPTGYMACACSTGQCVRQQAIGNPQPVAPAQQQSWLSSTWSGVQNTWRNFRSDVSDVWNAMKNSIDIEIVAGYGVGGSRHMGVVRHWAQIVPARASLSWNARDGLAFQLASTAEVKADTSNQAGFNASVQQNLIRIDNSGITFWGEPKIAVYAYAGSFKIGNLTTRDDGLFFAFGIEKYKKFGGGVILTWDFNEYLRLLGER